MDLKERHSTQTYEIGRFAEELNAVCGAFDVRNEPDTTHISGHLSTAVASGLEFAFVGQNTCQINRSARNIRQDPGNHYFLIFQEQGRAGMCQAGTETSLEPGDMFLIDSTLPSEFIYEGQFSRQISLHLPREEMSSRYGMRIKGGTVISRRDPLGHAMRSLLRQVLHDDKKSQFHVMESFYSVFGSYLMNHCIGQHSAPDPSQLIYDRAVNAMAQNFSEADFGVLEIAKKLGVSTRTLQRVFRDHGESPRQKLQQLRVSAARVALESDSH